MLRDIRATARQTSSIGRDSAPPLARLTAGSSPRYGTPGRAGGGSTSRRCASPAGGLCGQAATRRKDPAAPPTPTSIFCTHTYMQSGVTQRRYTLIQIAELLWESAHGVDSGTGAEKT